MKAMVVLIVLGVAGLGQYAYFQLFTKLAFNYEYELVIENVGGIEIPMVHSIMTRDWLVGLGGAIIGAILLGIGIYRLKHRKVRIVNS